MGGRARPRSITLLVPPRLNAMYRIGLSRASGKPGIFLTKAARRWKQGQGQMLHFLKPVTPKGQEVEVIVTWHMAPGDKGDLDGVLKLLLDTMQGYAYVSDAQVALLTIMRIRGAKQSKLEVTVQDLT